jgi:hypothetical protein
VTPTSRREVRYRVSGLVHWRFSEVAPAASDSRLRFQIGRWKAVQAQTLRRSWRAASRVAMNS